MAGSGVIDIVSGENGWTKQVGVSSEFWSTQTISTISGEYVNLTGALWADSNTPYTPNTSAYIQKDFQNITPGIYDVHMQAWCDSTLDDGGYLDTMMSSTGGIFEPISIKTVVCESSGNQKVQILRGWQDVSSRVLVSLHKVRVTNLWMELRWQHPM